VCPLSVVEHLLLRRLEDDGEVAERLLPRPISIALVLVLGVLLRWLDDDGEVDSSGTESFGLAAAVSSTSQ
jgi:hypothetical protein